MRLLRVLCLGLTGAAACSPDAVPPRDTAAAAIVPVPLPEPPALRSPVHLMEGDRYLRPTIPPYRTSADGRLAIGLDKDGGMVRLGLYAPERLTGPWNEAAPGVIGMSPSSVRLPVDDFYAYPYAPVTPDDLDRADHRTICDAWPVAQPRQNPYPCDGAPDQDCYDVTVVSSYRLGGDRIQLHGKPIRVKVAEPKTERARIAAVETDAAAIGAPAVAAGPVLTGRFGLEPTITSDGHLLVMRLGDTITTNPVTGTAGDRIDVVYLVSSGAVRCNVAAWNRWWPITHAPFDGEMDNQMPERYGFARYRFRDGSGEEYEDGEDLGGSYPWIDREGNNLFFTMISPTLWYEDTDTGRLEQRYAAACVTPGCVLPTTLDEARAVENSEQFRGFAFAGLWSRGKTVMLDNLANNLDYGLGHTDEEHRLLQLYAGADGWVRAGTGRDNDGPVPAGGVENTSFLDSWEHLFNHDEDARPTTVRDVVWTVHTGKATVEVAFDDYLDADAIILSDGNAATLKHQPFDASNQPSYRDGFMQTGVRQAWYHGGPALANAATPLPSRWAVPSAGMLEGDVRIEPVAQGGLIGKGVWLAGAGDRIAYPIPPQAPGVASPTTRTISLFLDPRFGDDGVARTILAMPDGTSVDLIGLRQLRYRRPNQPTVGISLARFPLVEGAWNHLAWVVTDDGATIHFFRDGYRWATTRLAGGRTMFGLLIAPQVGGPLLVGGGWTGASFRGWIDEIKVFARAVDLEHLCNLGHGTLVQLADGSELDALADRYDTHPALATGLGAPAGTQFACWHDYARPELALLRHLPAGATSIRGAVIFPEGPLLATEARPDSSGNPFCLGCHVDDGVAPPSLQPEALAADPSTWNGDTRDDLLAPDDPRRQPMQTPARIFGNVPRDYFRRADPRALANEPLRADPIVGEPVDPYVLVP